MKSPAKDWQNRTVPPQGSFTNRQKALFRPIRHGLTKPLLHQQTLLLRARSSPPLQRIKLESARIGWFNNQLELSSVELSDSAWIGVAEQRLEPLATQPEHQSQNSGSTGEKNVLHAD